MAYSNTGIKQTALQMRVRDFSMTFIKRSLGSRRSTLSYWFKDTPLTTEQKTRLHQNSLKSLAQARQKAAAAHRKNKQLRLKKAEDEAVEVMNQLKMDDATLELALARLYLGEGAKQDTTSIASSSPMILKFTLAVLKKNYGLSSDKFRCNLHLRADQNPEK